MIKVVVFDLDGTLVHLPINYEKLFTEFRKIIGMSNIHPLTQKISELDAKTKKKVFDVWNNFEIEAVSNLRLNTEGMGFYNKFSKKRKALVTMQGKPVVDVITERLKLHFDAIITREETLNRSEQLKIVAQKLGVSLTNVLFVGNTKEDSLAAEKVGCKFLEVGE